LIRKSINLNHDHLFAQLDVHNRSVMANYSAGKYDSSDAKAKQISLGYTYSLSKRTTLYGVYSHINNSNGSAAMASSGVSGLSLAGIADQNSSGFNVGIAHNF